MKTIKENVISKIEIDKSIFICYLLSLKNEKDFYEQFAKIKKEHSKARHHCYAFILAGQTNYQKYTDDGEPSKTAGLPMLNILQHNNLVNIGAVVVRYFGGIKLGTGGLVRTYGGSVCKAIEEAKLLHLELMNFYYLDVYYFDYPKIENILKKDNNYQLKFRNFKINAIDNKVRIFFYAKEQNSLGSVLENNNFNYQIIYINQKLIAIN